MNGGPIYGPCMEYLPRFIRVFLVLNVGTYSMYYGHYIYIHYNICIYIYMYIIH